MEGKYFPTEQKILQKNLHLFKVWKTFFIKI